MACPCLYFATVKSTITALAGWNEATDEFESLNILNFYIMKNLRNSVQLIGRLGQDPEVRTLTNGKKLTTFSLATSDYYKNAKGERVQDTQWHNIVAWGKVGEIAAEHLNKGEEIAMVGKLTHRSYENNEGEKRYVTEINLNELLMIGGKKA